jgi:6-phosphogluconolactonase
MRRRIHPPLALLWATLLWTGLAPVISAHPLLVYVGTFTNTGSHGIYAVTFDPANGSVSPARLAIRTPDPEFLVESRDHRHLYAVNEHQDQVSAFRIASPSGQLTFEGSRPTGGIGPAHVALDPTGQMLVIANYGGGSVAAIRLNADGSLGERSALLAPTGPPGPDRVRQSQSHPHGTTFTADGRWAFVCDLGLDRVLVYRAEPEHGVLRPSLPAFAAVPPGAGARHSVLSADGKFLYVVNELGGTISVFQWRPESGVLSLIETTSTLPPQFRGANTSAEIQLGADGRFIYASNRGSDSIAVLARNAADGRLSRLEVVSCGGRTPRHFTLSPDGLWLLCANQESGSVTVLAVDPASGRLTLTPHRSVVSQPVCLLFAGLR